MLRKLLYALPLVMFLFISNAHAQEMYYKLYKEKDYDKLEKRISQAIATQPNNIVFNHVAGILYAAPRYNNKDLDKAYHYLAQARTLYPKASDSEKDRIAKFGLTLQVINSDFDSVCSVLWEKSLKKNTVESCNYFLDTYGKTTRTLRDSIIEYRNELAFKDACKANTIEAYNAFLQNYAKSAQAEKAQLLVENLAYNQAKQTQKLEDYRAFLESYPTSKYHDEILSLHSKIVFTQATGKKDFRSYEHFVRNNAKNTLAPKAIEEMVAIAKEKQDIQLFKRAVDASMGIHFNYALYEYYKEFTKDGEYLTLYTFSQQYPRTFLDTLLAKDSKIASKGEKLDLQKPYDSTKTYLYEEYIKLAAPKEKAFLALQKYISQDVINKDWNTATKKVKKFLPYFAKDNAKVKALLDILQAPYDNSLVPKGIPGKVNTPDGGEYAPIITADNKYIYFCGLNRADNIGYEDIFISQNVHDSWDSPRIVKELSTSQFNEAVVSVSADGSEMIFFREGLLYYSSKSYSGWDRGVPLSKHINDGAWTGDAWITGDGKAIIFASVRDEGMNYYTKRNANLGVYHGAIHHQADLYVSLRQADGTWGKAKSLGPTINTIYTERSPYLHHDMKTLYFSSDGHGGLGNLDVYKSTRLSDTCWDCWSKPVNLGKEINTPEENWGYRISPDGKHFYYAARTTGEKYSDILYVSIPKKFLPEQVVSLSGKIVDSDNKPLPATIVYEDLNDGKVVGEAKTDPKDGTYFITLPNGKIYGYFVKHSDYYPQSFYIDLTKNAAAISVMENITAISFEQMKRDKIEVRLNNLFFDTNKSELLPYSIPELKRVAKIIHENHLKIEISGHTDDVGDHDFNVNLSIRRAEAVRDFLIQEGCDAQLFEIKGYGKTKPIDTNTTKEGRSRNRRVEMRFL